MKVNVIYFNLTLDFIQIDAKKNFFEIFPFDN